LCTAVASGLAALMTGGLGMTSPPPPAPAPPVGQSWVADLGTGNGMNVAYRGGVLNLTAKSGLLTLPAQHLHTRVSRINPALAARTPPGSVVEVDVRGLMADGLWSEWLPTTASNPASLPGPSDLVQVRVLLAGDLAGRPARPTVRALRLTGQLMPNLRIAAPPGDPAAYQVIATREGLVDGRTANGHRIQPHDLFVALPSHRALADTDGSEYTVKVCSRAGFCAWAPVWDIGPWNTTDDYWSLGREQFTDLPTGTPEAQAAFRDGANGGRDGSGRKVTNAAGIDLSDGVYNDVLGLSGNAQVNVSYLWTGNIPLSTVSAKADPEQNEDKPAASSDNPTGDPTDSSTSNPTGTQSGNPASFASLSTGQPSTTPDSLVREHSVTVRTAPDVSSPPAGLAADRAGVPVRCQTSNGWLRIDPDAYLPAVTVSLATPVRPC
jgi:hypothetical protein